MNITVRWIVLGVCILSAGAFSQETPDVAAQKEQLAKQLSLGSVTKNNFRDDEDKKWERIRTVTTQDRDGLFVGTMRFAFELTGSDGDVRWGQVLKSQSAHSPDYAGQDEWTFEIPHGDLKRPKVTAYAIEFGWESTKVFTPVVQDFYKVDSAAEILDRNKDPHKMIKIKSRLRVFINGDI